MQNNNNNYIVKTDTRCKIRDWICCYFPYSESLKRLESDYRNNLRKLQGDDREVSLEPFVEVVEGKTLELGLFLC